jgi:hypothetical protein
VEHHNNVRLISLFVFLLLPLAYAQGNLSGTVYASEVAGITIIACYPNDQGCDESLSGYVQITQSGTSAPFQINNLQAGQYLPAAWYDSNGDGVMDQAELTVYTVNGQATLVSVPTQGITLSFGQPQTTATNPLGVSNPPSTPSPQSAPNPLNSSNPLSTPSGNVPPELLGSWLVTLDSSSVGYVDPNSGSYAAPSGEWMGYTFKPDGSYEKTFLIQSSLYNCTMKVFWYEAGSANYQGQVVSLNPSQYSMTSEDNCNAENNYEKNLPLEPSSVTWQFGTDDYGLTVLNLTSVVKDNNGQFIIDPNAPNPSAFYKQEQ